MATNKALVNYTVQNIAYSANIADPTPSSKIRNITETFINELDNFDEYGTRVLNNMYIETCDSTFLDRIAAQEGLQRIRSQSIYLPKETMFVSIQNNSNKTYIRTVPQGYSFELSEGVWITFDEAVDLSNLEPTQDMHVSVTLQADETAGSLDLAEGSVYGLDIIPSLSILLNADVYVPLIEESEDEFRSRLLYARNTSRYGSEAAVKAAVASSSLISKYTIDYSTSPAKVYLYSSVLLLDDTYADTLETYAVNTVRSQLLQTKSAGTSFEVLIPSPVYFKVIMKPRVNNPRNIDPAFYGFSDFLYNSFNFGNEYIIDMNLIDMFKRTLSIDLDFLGDYNVEIIQTYMNFDYAAENNSITVHKNEFPFLESFEVGS